MATAKPAIGAELRLGGDQLPEIDRSGRQRPVGILYVILSFGQRSKGSI